MLQIGDKITINKIGWKVYDLDGNYLCLKCSHAYLKNKQCANCGAKRDSTGRFSEGDNVLTKLKLWFEDVIRK